MTAMRELYEATQGTTGVALVACAVVIAFAATMYPDDAMGHPPDPAGRLLSRTCVLAAVAFLAFAVLAVLDALVLAFAWRL